MKIKLSKALDLLQGSAAVIVMSDSAQPVIYASIDDGIFLSWEVDGLEYDATIPFSENEIVEIKNSTMALIGEDGEVIELKLLFPSQLESFCQESDIVE